MSQPLYYQDTSAGVQPLVRNYVDNPSLDAGHVCVGCIVWLPPNTDGLYSVRCNKAACKCGHRELDDGGYNHPVVVLTIRQRMNSPLLGDLVCLVACVGLHHVLCGLLLTRLKLTTFRDESMAKYLTTPHHRKISLPILDPEAPAVPSLIQLSLENGKKLKKQSYIRLQHTYEIPVSMLRQYAYKKCLAYKMRLSLESYGVLMEKFGLSPEVFELTKTLFETKDSRLNALALSIGSSRGHHPAEAHSGHFNSEEARRRRLNFPPVYRSVRPNCSVDENLPGRPENEAASSSLKWCVGMMAVGALIWWRYGR